MIINLNRSNDALHLIMSSKHEFILTGSRYILKKKDRDWDFITLELPDFLRSPELGFECIFDKKKPGYPKGGYRDVSVDEVWSNKASNYHEKIDIQVVRDTLMYVAKDNVNDFLKENPKTEFVLAKLTPRLVWNTLISQAVEDLYSQGDSLHDTFESLYDKALCC